MKLSLLSLSVLALAATPTIGSGDDEANGLCVCKNWSFGCDVKRDVTSAECDTHCEGCNSTVAVHFKPEVTGCVCQNSTSMFLSGKVMDCHDEDECKDYCEGENLDYVASHCEDHDHDPSSAPAVPGGFLGVVGEIAFAALLN